MNCKILLWTKVISVLKFAWKLKLACFYLYLWFQVNVGRGHFGNLEDADGQRDSTQDKQTVVDQDTGQDGMSDPSITADMKVIINLRQSSLQAIKALLCGGQMWYYYARRKCSINGICLFTSVIQSAPELLVLTMHTLNSPPGKVHWDTGRTNAEEPWRERHS